MKRPPEEINLETPLFDIRHLNKHTTFTFAFGNRYVNIL